MAKKDSINLAEYDTRRASLAERMAQRPYGSQSAAAFDTRTAPTLVSSVLGGKYISVKVLDTLEAWLNAKDKDSNAQSRSDATEAVPA